VFFAAVALFGAAAFADMQVRSDYAGANVSVKKLGSSVAVVEPDSSSSKRPGYYWNFEAKGGAGAKVRVEGETVVDAGGVFFSTDGGATWSQTGENSVRTDGGAAEFNLPKAGVFVRMSSVIPYQAGDFKKFARETGLKILPFCTTESGAQNFRVSCGEANSKNRLIITCRHHACETAASFVLEGVLAAAKNSKKVGVDAFPFIDLDSVERGEQGKWRAPRDFNQDYFGEPRYNAVAELKKFAAAASSGRRTIVLDLHSPSIAPAMDSENRANCIYFVFGRNSQKVLRAKKFSASLAELCQKTHCRLCNFPQMDIAYNPVFHDRRPRTFAQWCETLPCVELSAAIEIPFARKKGLPSASPDDLRDFGKALFMQIERGFE